MKKHQTGIALFATVVLSASAWAGAGPAGHGHEGFSAGEPGDLKKPARIVQVTMGEMDGKMMFMPAKVEVKKGEQIKFVLRNNGELDHEFILATTAENLKHGEAMKKILTWSTMIRMASGLLQRRRTRSSGNSPRPASSNTRV